MRKENRKDESSKKREQSSPQVRLPGFIIEEDVGLGDVIKRATSYLGIRPCEGCERRAATLNRWVVFRKRTK
jgi:hypothetical protein